ncbi:MAG: M42 family peptidase [Clostridia bacterium]|nr:M42 family peptidase [Clostridia bacterium]
MDRSFLNQLLNTVSVSGNEEPNQKNVIEYCRSFADRIQTDTVGNVIGVINPEAEYRVLLCGHIDEIGFRVTCIDDKGLIHIQKAGGVKQKLYVGAPMQIQHETITDGIPVYTKVAGVCAVVDDLLKKEEVKARDLVIDIGASTKEEAMAAVSVGDSVCADTVVRDLLGDCITCRALDDKTGVYAILEAAKRARENGTANGIYAASTVGEETTERGAFFAAAAIKPMCAVIVDVTWTSDCPGTDPADTGDIRLGAGPVLCKGSRVSKPLNRLLEQIAAEKQIPLQYEVAGEDTCTDADTVMFTGVGIPVVLISIPLRYMHSSVEVACTRDIDQVVELLSAFLCRIGPDIALAPLA